MQGNPLGQRSCGRCQLLGSRTFTRPADCRRRAQHTHRTRSVTGGTGKVSSTSSRTSSFQASLHELGTRVATAAGALGLSLLLSLSPLLQPVHEAHAVTNEQLVFLEAWRAIDRAYVDKSFNGQSWFRLRENYLKSEPMETREETYAAIRKALATLDDPFTRLLDPARFKALQRGTAGSVTGVGLEVGFINEGNAANSELVVITPSDGGPADKAGIESKDVLLSINGKTTKGLTLYDAGDLLQGAEGSEVTLLTRSHTDGAEKEYKLLRQKLSVNPVQYQLCGKPLPLPAKPSKGAPAAPAAAPSAAPAPAATSAPSEAAPKPEAAPATDGSAPLAGLPVEVKEGPDAGTNPVNTGYIKVATFSKQTAEGVKAAIKSLQAQGATRFVLDIRNNGGGLFPAGVDVAKMWMNDGTIVLIADSSGVRDSYDADGTALSPTYPLSVLVNRGTASASEVLAGALQDNKRATITGEQTFGKGLIQTIVALSDGSGVAVTVAKYQTPSGTDINRKGIEPDIKLPVSDDVPPQTPGEFCRFVQRPNAPTLFKKEVVKETLAMDKASAQANGAAASPPPAPAATSTAAGPDTPAPSPVKSPPLPPAPISERDKAAEDDAKAHMLEQPPTKADVNSAALTAPEPEPASQATAAQSAAQAPAAAALDQQAVSVGAPEAPSSEASVANPDAGIGRLDENTESKGAAQ